MVCCSNINWNVDVIKCLSALWRMLRRPKSGIKKLKKKMARLGGKRGDIRNQIDQAEREGKIPTNEVSQWLEAVETLEDEVTAIEQDFQSMSCFSCYYCCSINLRTAEKVGEANELMSQADGLNPIATDSNMPKSSIMELEKKMARLRCKRDDIKNQIDRAEQEGKIPTNEVSQWLRVVETLEGQVANIEQDFRRAAEKLSVANELMNQAGALNPLVIDPNMPKSSIKELEKEMARLRCKRDDIKNQIDQAKREGKILTNEVSQWLREVETLEGQVINIEQDFRRAAEKLSVANELMSQADALNPLVIDPNMPKSSIKELEKEMARLRSKRDDIKDQIDQAEREGKIPTKEVSQWLGEVETLEDQVINIEQDFRKAAEKLDKANELMNRASALDPIAKIKPWKHTVMLPISHRPPVGIESYVENIVGYIESGEGKIIGIYGMGGIGKTTILNNIHQHYLKHSKFDRVIWVVASKDCQLKRLQMDIAKSLGLNTLQENDDERTCGYKLFSYLKNKNCLLLLDDIWEHLDLQWLGMSIEEGQQQQPLKVVVLTTRSETVCGRMEAEKKIKVKCLDLHQAWQLFEQKCEGDVLSSDAGIKFVARELVKECAGLPLALVTVARTMTGKKSWEAWKDALHQIRDKHEWTTIGLGLSEDSLVMYKAFKLSYDSLENDSIRECLLCCALWPEDYEMDKFEELIPCWIGCGIIREFNVINEAFTKGYSYLDALMAASLLEYSSSKKPYYLSEKYVKMHDVIRDMALLMVSGSKGNGRKWIVKAGIGLNHLPRQEEWQEAERASFMCNRITHLQEYGAFTFPKLSMLILHGNRNLKTISQNLLPSMTRLTYLDLSFCDITELPVEIGNLTELQYLDVSNNPIRRLPAEFGCLGKLECLLLMNTYIECGPNEMISNLSMLKWLNIKSTRPMSEWWWDELKCFKGRHQLSVAIDLDATAANIERLNMLPNVSIWDLTIFVFYTSEHSNLTIDGDTSELPDFNLSTPQWSYNISDNLETLIFDNIKVGILMLTSGVGRELSFRSLKRLALCSLQLLEEISLNGGLYNLREIIILFCPMLKDVSWVLQLPCLSFLLISDCPRMKELISDVRNPNSISSIRSLNLFGLSNLTCIASQPLHLLYLEYIRVSNCPELKKLPFDIEISKSRLKEIHGEETWWHNLEWDDESNKNSLAPHFIPTSIFEL